MEKFVFPLSYNNGVLNVSVQNTTIRSVHDKLYHLHCAFESKEYLFF